MRTGCYPTHVGGTESVFLDRADENSLEKRAAAMAIAEAMIESHGQTGRGKLLNEMGHAPKTVTADAVRGKKIVIDGGQVCLPGRDALLTQFAVWFSLPYVFGDEPGHNSMIKGATLSYIRNPNSNKSTDWVFVLTAGNSLPN